MNWVLGGAGIVGSLALLAGFYGPMMLSDSNLGPLLGIFFTGPTGALLGAVVGCGLWAKRVEGDSRRPAWLCLAAIWLISLCYAAFLFGLAASAALWGVGVQLGVLAEGAVLLYDRSRRGYSIRARPFATVFVAVVGLVILMNLFPPVVAPWWGSPPARDGGAAESLPPVAFLFHPDFDASRHVPYFAVDLPMLKIEWVAAAIGGAIAWALLTLRERRAAPAR